MLEAIKRTIMFILGGIAGLMIVDMLKEQSYLTWNSILIVIVIAIIGSF